MAKSIRERAVAALTAQFKDQRVGVPTLDPYDFTWDIVRRSPLLDDERQERVLAVLEQDESKVAQFSQTNATLSVALEFAIRLNSRQAPSECLNEVLLNVQRQVREDLTLGGLTYNVREVGNSVDVDHFTDRQVRGIVFLEINYKHSEDDPREIRPGVVPA